MNQILANPLRYLKLCWQICLATYQGATRQALGLVAAGVAFFGLLAIFPAIAASIALAGLFVDPMTVASEYQDLMAVLPEDAALIVTNQATAIARGAQGGLGWAALLAVAIAFYSATRGISALVQGLNVACDLQETRSFLRLNGTVILLTLLAIIGALVSGFVSLIIPAILAFVGLQPGTANILSWISWGILLSISLMGLGVLFRFGPCYHGNARPWISVGTVLALLMWLGGSLGLAFYVSNFANYNETFGALGGVVILLLWLWVSAFVVLIGARIDTEIINHRMRTR